MSEYTSRTSNTGQEQKGNKEGRPQVGHNFDDRKPPLEVDIKSPVMSRKVFEETVRSGRDGSKWYYNGSYRLSPGLKGAEGLGGVEVLIYDHRDTNKEPEGYRIGVSTDGGETFSLAKVEEVESGEWKPSREEIVYSRWLTLDCLSKRVMLVNHTKNEANNGRTTTGVHFWDPDHGIVSLENTGMAEGDMGLRVVTDRLGATAIGAEAEKVAA